VRAVGDVFRRALGHDVAAGFAASWDEVEHLIHAFDDILVMFPKYSRRK